MVSVAKNVFQLTGINRNLLYKVILRDHVSEITDHYNIYIYMCVYHGSWCGALLQVAHQLWAPPLETRRVESSPGRGNRCGSSIHH